MAPWQSVYSNSKVVSGAITFVHLAGLLFGGGFAIAADRATLRAAHAAPESRNQVLIELDAVHRPVLLSLGALFVSGLLQLTADIETFAASPVFWTKMGLVALLMGNGYRLMRTERALRARDGTDIHDPLWRRLQWTAVTSVVLWAAIVLAGTVLTNIS
jgi:uncharacterized membrane-anchored protein